MPKDTPSIRRIFLAGMISLALVSMGLWEALWIYSEYGASRAELGALQEKYLEAREDLLRDQVANVVDYICYMKEQTEARLKSSVKERVDEACDVAMNLYARNRDDKTDGEIQEMIRDALLPIRFDKGRGYFFSFNLNGIDELFSGRTGMEGRTMLPMTGAKGELVVRDMIDLAFTQDEGFYAYSWTRPGEGEKENRKIAYVKLFEPYGWIIGASEDLDDVGDEIQNEVLKRIVNIRLGTEGYLFGDTLEGRALFANGKIANGTSNILDISDANGGKIFQEQKKAAEGTGGGFVRYSSPKPESSMPVSRLEYVLEVPGWEWIIGAGVYLDKLELESARKREILRNNLVTKIQTSLLILLPLLAIIFAWVRYLSNRIQSGINTFSSFFDRAATQAVTIDPSELHILEFQKLADLANTMVSDRKRVEAPLRESEARLDLALRSAQMGVWRWDISDNRHYFDDQACYLLGIDPATFTGGEEEFFAVIHPEDHERLRAAQARTIQQDMLYETEFRAVWPDGSVHYLAARGKLLHDGRSRPVRINGITWEITDSGRGEQEIV